MFQKTPLPNTVPPAIKLKGGSWLACDGGGTAEKDVAWPAAFAASLKLDSSHRGTAVFQKTPLPNAFPPAIKLKGGSWLACEGGGTAEKNVDSPHRGAVVRQQEWQG
ncbi:hypothetical protein [Pseudomonas sp. B22129]|uniref:hypothetical protein n=1 Tax=Pseudomonas sp. B22129 TaxID=3235111 RepID=UPI003783D3C8